MTPVARPHVLCVDDEPNVLEGLALNLRRRFDVVTATSGAAGLEALERDKTIAVVVSDMRMPGMDGAEFLRRAREALPDTARILLTGQADLDSAIAAVNDGQVFRFLTKPCAPATLIAAIQGGAELHRLIQAERVLLEQTLHGSIKTLIDVLALTNPVSFGRATRIKKLVSDLASQLELRERWQVEVAAMVSQLGCITLPQETVEKVYYGRDVTEAEQQMVARVPAVTEQLLANIPRLEAVREIIHLAGRPPRPRGAGPEPTGVIEVGSHLLRVASDFDSLEAQGVAATRAIDTLRGRAERYSDSVLAALASVRGTPSKAELIRELPVSALRAGMTLAEDVKLSSGTLLVARGYEITSGFIERVNNFRPGTVREPVRVVVQS